MPTAHPLSLEGQLHGIMSGRVERHESAAILRAAKAECEAPPVPHPTIQRQTLDEVRRIAAAMERGFEAIRATPSA